MGGVFVRKLVKRTLVLGLLALCVLGGMVVADKQLLRENLIRLHVVANSDSQEDQAIKLEVRDAIIAALQEGMDTSMDADEAKEYLSAHLTDLEMVANAALARAGSTNTATVALGMEEFPVREYDTFSLPSGVYESLRVTIGEGEGHNWWCVVFPSLCVPATSADFTDAAVAAGFPEDLANTLAGDYEVRFFLLDYLGRLENFLGNS